MRSLVNYSRGLGRRVVSFLDDGIGTGTPNAVLANRIIKFIFFPSLRVGGILQILQSDWFRERAVFYDLARQPGRNGWQLHSKVCLLFVNEQKPRFLNQFSFKTCAIIRKKRQKF